MTITDPEGKTVRLQCWYCHKPVTNPIPKGLLQFRAIAICPECVEKSPEASNHPLANNETSISTKHPEGCGCHYCGGAG